MKSRYKGSRGPNPNLVIVQERPTKGPREFRNVVQALKQFGTPPGSEHPQDMILLKFKSGELFSLAYFKDKEMRDQVYNLIMNNAAKIHLRLGHELRDPYAKYDQELLDEVLQSYDLQTQWKRQLYPTLRLGFSMQELCDKKWNVSRIPAESMEKFLRDGLLPIAFRIPEERKQYVIMCTKVFSTPKYVLDRGLTPFVFWNELFKKAIK